MENIIFLSYIIKYKLKIKVIDLFLHGRRKSRYLLDYHMVNIIKPIERYLNHYESIVDLVSKSNQELKTAIIKREVVETNRYLGKYLELPIATKLIHIIRLRIINNIPAYIENSWLPMTLFPNFDNIEIDDKSLYKILHEHYNFEIYERREELMLVRASDLDKEYLKVNDESNVLLIKGITKQRDGRIIEYFENTALPELFIFKGE